MYYEIAPCHADCRFVVLLVVGNPHGTVRFQGPMKHELDSFRTLKSHRTMQIADLLLHLLLFVVAFAIKLLRQNPLFEYKGKGDRPHLEAKV